MFAYYDECVLLFCRSTGSSVEAQLNKWTNQKAVSTAEFIRQRAKKEIDTDLVELIINEQFRFYRQVLKKGYDKEKTVRLMDSIEEFHESGWKGLFEKNIKRIKCVIRHIFYESQLAYANCYGRKNVRKNYAAEFNIKFRYSEEKKPALVAQGGIEKGKCIVLCGVSGCGKTTLLRCLNGLVPAFYDGLLKGFCRLNGRARVICP